MKLEPSLESDTVVMISNTDDQMGTPVEIINDVFGGKLEYEKAV